MSAQVKAGLAVLPTRKWSQQPNKMMVPLVGKDWLRILLAGSYSGMKIHHPIGKANGVTRLMFS